MLFFLAVQSNAPHFIAVEEPNEALLGWVDDKDIKLYHLGLQEGGAPWDAITVESITDALEVFPSPGSRIRTH